MQVRRLSSAAALLLCLATLPARAEDVRVLAAGAVQGAVRQLEAEFSAASGHTLKPQFDTVGALRNRVLAGERGDVVILSEAGISALAAAAKIEPATRIELGGTAVALAVRKGAPMPDLSSADALRRSLLAATSIAYADPARGATAGAHFASVLDRLGIAAELGARVTVLPFGGDVIKAVAEGRFQIGVSQSSEIVANADVVLAGRLPPPFDHRTRYVAAKGVGAGPGADAFLALLQGSSGRAALMAIGFAER
ncbi:MAG TPA: substrate-binding domain-containing protein [Hyphomicrobiaceae bacterium]|nr:substrate-binding domain-containing protein [Hyphomicrobiaceae bacterium]